MAKTAWDYSNEGAHDFKEGRVRPVGNSWQAKARIEGFDQAEFECVKGKIEEAVPMHNTDYAIRSHIECLRYKSTCCDNKTEWRIKRKIAKLEKKHHYFS